MNPIYQLCHCDQVRAIAEGTAVTYQLYLCSPHPAIQVVIISGSGLSFDRFIPQKMVELANYAVTEFALHPSQVIWVEYISAQCSAPTCAGFNLIQFDWQAGHATSPHRSPIYEDWYLSWLEAKVDHI